MCIRDRFESAELGRKVKKVVAAANEETLDRLQALLERSRDPALCC